MRHLVQLQGMMGVQIEGALGNQQRLPKGEKPEGSLGVYCVGCREGGLRGGFFWGGGGGDLIKYYTYTEKC